MNGVSAVCAVFLLHLFSTVLAARAINSPPQIVRQPLRRELLFHVARSSDDGNTPFIIECEAKGHPRPRYVWHKNGQPFRWTVYSSRVSQQPGLGTLVISSPRDTDAGIYQCFANNKFGTAVSNSVIARRFELGSFKNQPAISISANEGDRLRLDCDPPEGYPPPIIYWMVLNDNGGLRSINSSRMTVDPQGTLWFSNVTMNDASDNSVYACSATSPFKTEYKVGNRVRLTVIPNRGLPGKNRRPVHEQYVSPRKTTVLRGERLALSCIYGGTPLPTVEWQRYDGRLTVDGQRTRLEDYGKTLVIEPLRMEDEGDYVCTASNGVGQSKTETFSVKLEARPYFTTRPQLQMAAEGESVEFHCEADGVPKPTITWTRNSEPLSQSEADSRLSLAPDGSRLTLIDLTDSDTANYGCNASNRLGYVYQDVYVNVLSLPAEIIERPKDRAVVEGATVELGCTVFGAPKPSVTWRKADSPTSLNSVPLLAQDKYKVDENGTLKISDVEFMDAGTYVCVAENKLGDDSANSSLAVREPSRIETAPQSQRTIAGSAVTLTCESVTDPELTARVSWLADGWPIDPATDNRYRVNMATGSLTIVQTDVSSTMNYTCIVSTELDRVNTTAQLIVEDVPEPPTLLTVTCRAREADVEWRSNGDNNAPITGYIIQASTGFEPDRWQTLANPPASPSSFPHYTVPLSPWANYTLRVLARNSVGPSQPSSEQLQLPVCETPAAVPDKNPENVQAVGTAPGNLQISWKPMPPLEHNAPDFRYRVSWRQDSVGEPWQTVEISDWRQQRHLVSEQPIYSSYLVRVEALNELGESVIAAEDVRGWSGEDVPTDAPSKFNVTEILDGHRAIFSWSPVDTITIRGQFKGYKIETWSAEEGEQTSSDTVFPPGVTSGQVTNLRPYAMNRAQIRVFNGAYSGPASTVLAFRMPEGVPSAVASLDAVPLGSDSLYVTWSQPLEVNGQLTGYRLRHQRMSGIELGPEMESRIASAGPRTATRTILSGLDTNTKYRLTVLATTNAGPGTPYYVERSTRTTTPRLPDIPDLLWNYIPPDEDSQSGHSIQVIWLPNIRGHPGSHFFVQYRVLGNSEWTSTDTVVGTDVTVLRQLDDTVLYELRTVSVDGHYTRPSRTVQAVASSRAAGGPAVEASAGHVTASSWFIAAVCAAVALLLLVLLATLVCAARRNRGGKYDVYDRELAHGRRDLNEEKGFQELRQPLDCPDGITPVGGGLKSPRDSDSDSMAEYGDDAAGKFTEDGSFIGQYGAQKRNGYGTNGVAYV